MHGATPAALGRVLAIAQALLAGDLARAENLARESRGRRVILEALGAGWCFGEEMN